MLPKPSKKLRISTFPFMAVVGRSVGRSEVNIIETWNPIQIEQKNIVSYWHQFKNGGSKLDVHVQKQKKGPSAIQFFWGEGSKV
jgi:hypothetical protein